MALSKAAWMNLPAGQRGNWSYQKYSNWVAKTAMGRQQARAAARIPPGQPSALVDIAPPPAPYGYTPYVPRSHARDVFPGFMPTDQAALRTQAQSFVNQSVNPVLANIKSQFTTREQQGAGRINQYASDLASSLQPLAGAYGQISNQEMASLQNVDSGLASFIKNQAQALGDQSAAGFQDPGSAARAAAQAAGLGASTGVANAADTSASMSQAVADKAAMQQYAALQPGLARGYGTQQLANFESGIAQDQSSALSQVTNQVPGMVGQMFQNLLDRELQKAQGLQGLRSDAAGRDLTAFQMNQQGRSQATNDAMARWQAMAGLASGNADRALTAWATQQSLGAIDPAVSAGLGFPATSQGIGNPNQSFYGGANRAVVPGSKNDPAVIFQGRVDKTADAAQKVISGWYNHTVPGAFGAPPQKDRMPNNRATLGAIAFWATRFPGQDNSWILARARSSLVSGGYTKALIDPLLTGANAARVKQNPAAYTVPASAAPRAAATATPAKTGATAPPVSAAATGTGAPMGERAARTTQKPPPSNQDQSLKAAKEADALVAPSVGSRGGVPYHPSVGDVYTHAYTVLRQHYPSLPPAQIDAIVRSALGRRK